MGKKILKIALIVLGVVVVLAVAFVLYLTLTEYKPADVEAVETLSYGDAETPGSGITLMTWNIGYCGLGANEDFVMDGGAGSGKPEREDFNTYYDGVLATLREHEADVYLMQEVDSDSARSYRVDEARGISESLGAASSSYALNYSCPFVPFPWPPRAGRCARRRR